MQQNEVKTYVLGHRLSLRAVTSTKTFILVAVDKKCRITSILTNSVTHNYNESKPAIGMSKSMSRIHNETHGRVL